MWADESVGADGTEVVGDSEELIVPVDGEEYTAELNTDLDEDGVADMAVIEHEDGSAQGFVDVDGDGTADEYIALDTRGEETAHAVYDEDSGDWVEFDPEDTEDGDVRTNTGQVMTADLPEGGGLEIGPPTIDTNDDGVNDTAMVEDDSGNTVIFTDVDGDGQADVAVTVDSNGQPTEYEHTGDGEWEEKTSTSEDPGSDQFWGGESHVVEGVARIDSLSGQWISQN